MSMDFTTFVENIKKSFKKEQKEIFNGVKEYDALQLASSGDNDAEGYQIFTPQFIVKQMTDLVEPEVLDFTKTVLEPTSGDGAFTTYILQKRLEIITDNFEIESLKALSTIYSIEMDKELIDKQRNNIFTLIKLYTQEKNINIDASFFDMVKCVITTNFLWAMFNIKYPIDGLFIDVALKMPDAEKKEYRPLQFPVWCISNETITVHYEDVDL